MSLAQGASGVAASSRVVRGVVVTASGRSDALIRLPSATGKDRAPGELVAFARDAIERGLQVRVRRTWSQMLLRLAAVAAVCVGCGLVLTTWIDSPVGIPLAFVLTAGVVYALVKALSAPGYADRLKGRPVAGAGRESTGLWRQAVAEVVAGSRSETELPGLHRLLVEVANAEDKVSRLARRSRYDLDQSEVDVARQELASLVDRARADLGQPALALAPTPYLASRWSDDAGVEQPEPAHPEDLR